MQNRSSSQKVLIQNLCVGAIILHSLKIMGFSYFLQLKCTFEGLIYASQFPPFVPPKPFFFNLFVAQR